ncbi:MAG: tetratricopeptide repeat protein [Nitrospinota bacterium]|nr:tetratricopeptide repeat protein [Nitrospinota bacterium]
MASSFKEKALNWNRPQWPGLLIIVLLTFLAYSPALNGDFIWDDDLHITKKKAVIGEESFKRIWTTSDAVYYPLVLTTFWVEWRLWSGQPMGFHIVNVLLHVINAILLCFLFHQLGIKWAWLGGAIFALHPVHVESVAWITELKNVQSGFFYLLTLLFYLRFLDNRRRQWYLATLIMFLAALLSKPSTVMLPVILLIIHWWLNRPLQKKDIFSIVPFFVLSALVSLWTIWEQQYHSGAIGPEWSIGLLERIAIAGYNIWFYIIKLLFPYNLTFFYPRWEIDPLSIIAYFPLALLLILCLASLKNYTAWGKSVFIALSYFTVTLFPILGFFNFYFMRYSFVGDHFQYLPSIGIIALITCGSALYFEKWDLAQTKKTFCWQKIGAGLGLAVLLIFGALTWKQGHIYKDMETLLRDTINKNPKAWMAHSNLGMMYAEKGLLDKALVEFKETLRIYPDNSGAHNSLGNIYLLQKKYKRAIETYRGALKLDPENKGFLYNLALSYEGAGNLKLAKEYYKKILENESPAENQDIIKAVKNRFLNLQRR